LASFLLQVLGALWYILAIQREDTCWREACNSQEGCDLASLYCGSTASGNNSTFLQDACPTDGDGADVDPIFGIYLPALQNVSQSSGFFQKLFYCFWWGLQNLWYIVPNPPTHTPPSKGYIMPWDLCLCCVAICINCSSYGQNLKTSTYIWENLFAVFVSMSGLVLFALLIGNVQVQF
jgi:cyclic nucleotide gated channel, plant